MRPTTLLQAVLALAVLSAAAAPGPPPLPVEGGSTEQDEEFLESPQEILYPGFASEAELDGLWDDVSANFSGSGALTPAPAISAPINGENSRYSVAMMLHLCRCRLLDGLQCPFAPLP